MSNWRPVCQVSDVEEGSPRSVDIDGNPVGIFCVGGAFFAIDDVCPHEYALLSAGFQDGDIIECPLHQAMFDIKTGENLTPPATCGVRVYPVRIEGDRILVDCASIAEDRGQGAFPGLVDGRGKADNNR